MQSTDTGVGARKRRRDGVATHCPVGQSVERSLEVDPSARDRIRAGENPYLEAFQEANGEVLDSLIGWSHFDDFQSVEELAAVNRRRGAKRASRTTLTRAYAWAVPNAEALDVLAEHAPILEVGAGTGYWAALMRARGVDVIATDKVGPGKSNHWHPEPVRWASVRRMSGVKAVRAYRDRTLFLCWPPYDEDSSSYDVLRAFTGDRLIYVGEANGGCTGSRRFGRLLDAHWSCVQTVGIPQWYGLHDYLMLYHRRDDPQPIQPERCYRCGRFTQSSWSCDHGEAT